MADAPEHVGAGLSHFVRHRRQQYIAVTTGLGGGSPRRIPSLLAREIRYPETGNALYVFKLRDRK